MSLSRLKVTNISVLQSRRRPTKEQAPIAGSFVAAAVMKHQHASSLGREIAGRSEYAVHLRLCKENYTFESTFLRAFAEFAGTLINDAQAKEYLGTE
jgi:hypothetical protein